MTTPPHQLERSHRCAGAVVSWSIGPALLLLAAWLLWFAPDARPDIPTTPRIDLGRLAPIPRSPLLSDPPAIAVGGFEQRCNECHRLFVTAPDREGPLYQHTHIEFDHGINNRCFNCHGQDDRQTLVLRDGRALPFARSPELCSQCHGTTYRDWQRGMHGKTLGAWRVGAAEMRRLACVECHDPHAPAYDPIEPLPAPHTLRAENAGRGPAGHGESASPLALPRPHENAEARPPGPDETHAPAGGHAP